MKINMLQREAKIITDIKNDHRYDHFISPTVFQISPYSAYLHDAVLLYAMGLKEVLKDGKDPYDGRELLQRLKNRNNIRFYGW